MDGHLSEKDGEGRDPQGQAIEAISQRIRTSHARLEDPRRPIKVFLLVGPSGLGKTETVLALADTLYGGERNMVTINIAEYQEAHTVSGLKGSPPGYVGYGEGGILTEAVQRKPYSVVLLDEMEKAHTDVMELFYQVFDKGVLEDAKGWEIDFKNTVILMTSNVGSETIMKLCADPETRPDLRRWSKRCDPSCSRSSSRLFSRAPDEVENGARNVDRILTHTLLPEISQEFLARMAVGKAITKVHVSLPSEGGFRYEVA